MTKNALTSDAKKMIKSNYGTPEHPRDRQVEPGYDAGPACNVRKRKQKKQITASGMPSDPIDWEVGPGQLRAPPLYRYRGRTRTGHNGQTTTPRRTQQEAYCRRDHHSPRAPSPTARELRQTRPQEACRKKSDCKPLAENHNRDQSRTPQHVDAPTPTRKSRDRPIHSDGQGIRARINGWSDARPSSARWTKKSQKTCRFTDHNERMPREIIYPKGEACASQGRHVHRRNNVYHREQTKNPRQTRPARLRPRVEPIRREPDARHMRSVPNERATASLPLAR